MRGAHGAAGEIGSSPGADALAAENQRRGPLEEAVAGDALVARYRAATGDRVCRGSSVAAAGDLAAFDALDEEGRWTAAAIVAVAAILDPEVFVLGGGIGSQPSLLPHSLARAPRRPRLLTRLANSVTRTGAGAMRLAIDALPSRKEHERDQTRPRLSAALVALPWRDFVVYIGFVLDLRVLRGDPDPRLPEPANLTNIVIQTAPITIMAIGLVFVLAAGEIDLSIGSIVALSALARRSCSTSTQAWPLAALAGLAAGAVVGL